jgi:predicted enzyme related to lactoylglutathione lyase
VDAFFPAVFPITAKRMGDPKDMDYKVWEAGGQMVAGRFKLEAAEAPAKAPARIDVYFAVENCDDAIARVNKLGGRVTSGPTDSPFGRFATVVDTQGASVCVIDLSTTVGEPPPMAEE